MNRRLIVHAKNLQFAIGSTRIAASARPLLKTQHHAHLLPWVFGAALGALAKEQMRIARGRCHWRGDGFSGAVIGPGVIRQAIFNGTGCLTISIHFAQTRQEVGATEAAWREGGTKILGGRRRRHSLRFEPDTLFRVFIVTRAGHHHHTIIAGRGEVGSAAAERWGVVGVQEGQEDRLLH